MSKIHSPLEQELWNDWIEDNSNDAANELITNYMYLVNFHVERISIHLPNNVHKEDLKSLGLLGLYDALKKYDPSRDLKFDTYASIRVRGAIMDGLRKEDWLPRSMRGKVKKIEKSHQTLEQIYHRTPTAAEIAQDVGMTIQEVESTIKDSLFANVLSIEDKSKDSDKIDKEGIGYTIAGNKSVIPEAKIMQMELEGELTEAIKDLNENEQMVVSLFYFDELTLTEIGKVLNLTTSRISQIHKRAIVKLRETLLKIQNIS
ncbi:FliA/WhiG family RNA polymerase sigma factor [Oceanobacillus halophilus]|uniref:FliA/WhiG family RNA polymerase sigma factor n=1 Tax=Oceanobacillus halophilus TaxID=930130 RepID=A0A495ABZ1_9BACI|nr:FliA/WhiG family RNA polymerase sigma factor [Oceanobacillus halophilus]RKQ37506.1 FliA/WhiG family RNA polymerase sigma factor [Oceanobacillus halophilus]